MFTLLALLILLALAACDGGLPQTVTTAPTQGAANTEQQLQATIEALQTVVVEQDADAPDPTEQSTTDIENDTTSQPTAEGAQEPEATEVPVAAATEEVTEVPNAQDGTPLPPGEVPSEPLIVVALGDSLTEGQGDTPAGGGYPARLLALIRPIRSDTAMINLGVSGYTSQQMIEQELPAALDANPDIALVWIGGNNLWNNGGPEREESDLSVFRADIDTTLRSLTTKGVRVFVGLVVDQAKSPYATSPNGAALDPEGVAHMSHLVTEFNKIVSAKAAQYGVTTVDTYNTTIFTDPATLAEDEAHPNAAGYDLITRIWFEAIRPALK